LLWALPAVVTLLLTGMLLALAKNLADAFTRLGWPYEVYIAAYRLVASLIWFSCLTVLTWSVLRDCAAEGLSKKQLRRRRCCLPTIPICAAAVEFGMLLPHAIGYHVQYLHFIDTDTLAKFADIGALTVAYALNFIVLPLSLFLPRRRAAYAALQTFEDERAGVAAARRLRNSGRRPGGDEKRDRRARRRSVAARSSKADPPSADSGPSARYDGPISIVALAPPPFMGPPSTHPVGAPTPPPATLPPPQTLEERRRARLALSERVVSLVPPKSMGPPLGRPTGSRVAPPCTLAPPSAILRLHGDAGELAHHHAAVCPRKEVFLDGVHAAANAPAACVGHDADLDDGADGDSARGSGGAISGLGGRQAWLRAAAVVVQKRQREKTARKVFAQRWAERRRDQARLSWPILVAAMLELTGTLIIDGLQTWRPALVPEWMLAFSWLLLLLPGLCIVLRDLAASRNGAHISFSIAHAIFFCGSLYRASYRAISFSVGVARLYNELLPNSATATLLGQASHQLCFALVTTVAKARCTPLRRALSAAPRHSLRPRLPQHR
jgi:hypothetical protein